MNETYLPGDLKIPHVAVEIDPVQALQVQGHVTIQKIAHRQRCSHTNSMTAAQDARPHPPRRSEAKPHWVY